VIVVLPTGNSSPEFKPVSSVLSTETFPFSSLAVGVSKVTTAPHSPGSFSTSISWGGQSSNTGAVSSSSSVIVTVKLQVAVFPFPSSTTKVLVVVIPIGNSEPEESPAVCVIVALPQLSLKTGLAKVISFPVSPKATLSVILTGQDTISGSSVSSTITSKLQVTGAFVPSSA